MSIAILPARLANQIAAGEVVERPASVVKELVENSIDAGANKIVIDIEQGGAKRIKICDNGMGIAKDELTLALSRHATSKIKNLDDLESIHSLGFRGEALASISSVSRLTLTSMPNGQDSAWQAIAVGRDMSVEVKPAAHPIGTTINVEDLFFNTPARRKFMRTEKTEFSHIDEVVKRIALSKLELTIILNHNGKTIRQYRSATTEKQIEKRIASVCGQAFIDNAVPLEFDHDGLHLWGWIGKPSFSRTHNDLAYSYVNGRMMRDKLINHAIRQAYGNQLQQEGFPAFVLFFSLDFKDVDVNVHPAKHEVRFHQARFVHDFICSAIEQTLSDQLEQMPMGDLVPDEAQGTNQQVRDYIQPLQVSEPNTSRSSYPSNDSYRSNRPSANAVESYHALLTPIQLGSSDNKEQLDSAATQFGTTPAYSQNVTPNLTANVASMVDNPNGLNLRIIRMLSPYTGLFEYQQNIICMSLRTLQQRVLKDQLVQSFQAGLISQPLLLPIKIQLSTDQFAFVNQNIEAFLRAGIVVEVQKDAKCVIKQFPAQLRENDIQQSFIEIIQFLNPISQASENDWIEVYSQLKLPVKLDLINAQQLLMNVNTLKNFDLSEFISLNSMDVDLTSYIKQLDQIN